MSAILYNIQINQFAILQNKINLDIVDIVVLQAISYLINTTPEGNHISYKSIIELIPVVKNINKKTIQLNIDNLINQWMIEKEIKNRTKTYFKFWPRYHLITL